MAPQEDNAQAQRHKPGIFKQQNKSHKTGRHRSKGQLQKEAKGRANAKIYTGKKAKQDLSKQDRRHQATQIRKNKREEVLAHKRSRGGQNTAPYLVTLVPLCPDVDAKAALELIKSCDEEATVCTNDLGVTHISLPRFKQRLSFLIPDYGNLYALLDATKVSDTLLFITSANSGIDEYGELTLSSIFAHGLPACVHAVQGLKSLPTKKQTEAKKQLQKDLHVRFPEAKWHSLDSEGDALVLLRQIGSQKLRQLTMRELRPHLLAESISFALNDADSQEGTLLVSGYLRGQALSVNGLVHLPGWGDFQMNQLDAPTDPHPLSVRPKKPNAMEEALDEVRVLEKADTSRQESLQAENVPDPMEGEQTWPTEEELAEAEEENKSRRQVKRVPKGTSQYQAAWIMDSDNEGQDDEEESEDDFSEDEEMMAEDAVSQEDEEGSISGEDAGEGGDDMEYEELPLEDKDAKYDSTVNIEEEEEMLRKYKEARMDEMFPDEMDTPKDSLAHTRFAKYRGLKSFRTSPWDPKENLPLDYARIFQFSNFKQTRRGVLKEERTGAMPGWYITVHIRNVPKSFMESYRPGHPVVLFGLLPHEQKMSVVHMLLKRHLVEHVNPQPIKSKERLVFHVGYRRFSSCPIYSQHTNGDKHKFERFLRPEGVTVASMYAPIMFPPASVLAFKETHGGGVELVATGSLLSVDPDRIVAKRVVLSGHPFRIINKLAVIRYMFFNRDDILWFKPVELRTKHGRRGHIKEPLGTHGHMKCVFDGQLKSMDTVLMNLYKRMYPKWTYNGTVVTPTSFTTSSGAWTQKT